MKVWIPLALLTLTALAGCADEPATSDDDGDEPEFEDVHVSSDKGIIRGVVVDATVTPVSDVTVSLRDQELSTETGDQGTFQFADLEPQLYFLEISKPGFRPTQTSTEVVAGEKDPDIIKIQLEADPSARPIAELLTFEGYLQCGAGISGVGAVNPCYLTESVNTFTTEVQKPVDFSQIELYWEGTNTLGDGLNVGIFDPSTTASNFVSADGGSPLTLRVPGETIENALGEDYEDYLIRVFPGSSDNTVVLEQRFQIFVTHFYGLTPDEGWTYIEDGDYPIPE